jgi:hypothetical protein
VIGNTQTRLSSGTFGIAVLALGLTALAMFAPPMAVVVGPGIALGGVYLIRRGTDGAARAVGVIATTIGLLMTALTVLTILFLLPVARPNS